MKTQKPERLTREREAEYLAAMQGAPRFTTVETMPEVARQLRVIHCRFYPHMEASYASIGLSL